MLLREDTKGKAQVGLNKIIILSIGHGLNFKGPDIPAPDNKFSALHTLPKER